MMDALTAFDAIVIVLLILSTIMAFARGFMRELATLGAFIAALAAAYYARLFLRDGFATFLPEDTPAWLPDLILFVSAFLLVYIIVAWFGANLSRSIQGVDGVGFLDRLAGAAAGVSGVAEEHGRRNGEPVQAGGVPATEAAALADVLRRARLIGIPDDE